MPSLLSRRHWVLFMGAAPILAQTAPQTPAAIAPLEQRTAKAQADVHQVSDKLAAIQVPMNIEPSFRFKA